MDDKLSSLSKYSDDELFLLGMSAVVDEQPIDLSNTVHFSPNEHKNLNDFSGITVTDRGNSMVLKSLDELAFISFIIGTMKKYGFPYLGILSSCYPNARAEGQIENSFELKLKFYQDQPDADICPNHIFEISVLAISKIAEVLLNENNANDIRLHLLLKVEPFLSEKNAPAVMEKLAGNVWDHDGVWWTDAGRWSMGSHFYYTDSTGHRHNLDDYKAGVVLVDEDGFPVATGPEAVLQA